MFEKARIKLTVWYLLIIMLISIIFSLVIYFGATNELDRIQKVQRLRQQEASEGLILPNKSRIDPEILEESRSRIRLALVLFNGLILVFSGAAGYFLAGRTLKPIEEMINEQKKFVSGASHELRTPLTALKTSTEVGLRDKKLTLGEAKSLLRDNLDEVENLRVLSDSLLRLSQFEKINGDNVYSKILISVVLDEAKRKISTLAKSKKVDIEIVKPKGKVEGDRASLVELFVILLDNAVKYSPKGSKVEVTVTANDGKVEVRVQDFGMGIAKRDMEHIFDRFYRGDKARSKENVSGYGLGLSIAKKIVELHKGSIEVESGESKGSTFCVILPNVS